MAAEYIRVRGAREHNLKNIDVDIPKNKFVVITGPSGSGKSSLAFSTIHAEGQRRYLESLSAYARQFLQNNDKPDVDHIYGLSPSIAIDQRTTSNNPRSTVATVTEINDYLRLLFARAGTPHCPICGKVIAAGSVQSIAEQINNEIALGEKFQLIAPVVQDRKGEFVDLLSRLRTSGYSRIIIDGEAKGLEEDIVLKKQDRHTIEVVVDRLVMKEDFGNRLLESLESCLELTEGLVIARTATQDFVYSSRFACPEHGAGITQMEPRIFSFNSPLGSCAQCHGLGHMLSVDINKIITNKNESLQHNLHSLENIGAGASVIALATAAAVELGIDMSTVVADIPSKKLNSLWYGNKKPLMTPIEYKGFRGRKRRRTIPFHGMVPYITQRYQNSGSDWAKGKMEAVMSLQACSACNGQRLKPEVLAVTIADTNIAQVSNMNIRDARTWIRQENFTPLQWQIVEKVVREIQSRLDFLLNVGVGYLQLSRMSGSLSGGEAQRLRLSSALGSALSGAMYVLDEPSIGLSPSDNDLLIATLRNLRDLGNTLLVVEHDHDTQLAADYLIDMGPLAGEYGGTVTAQGTPKQVAKGNSLTGRYLSGKESVPIREPRPWPANNEQSILTVKGAAGNNLQKIDVDIPLGSFTCVTGVSGSGKSTLIMDTLVPALAQYLGLVTEPPAPHEGLSGAENIHRLVQIDQSPIGRTPKSNPVTYTKIFDHIRQIFASTQLSRTRGYKPGRFSFNVPNNGRCEHCRGDGTIEQDMLFLPSVAVVCEVCNGKRYNAATLEVTWKGHNINDVLNLSVDQALEVFSSQPKIKRRLQTLHDVGLGYLQLGASSLILSGGESQRVKIAAELAKNTIKHTVFVLDEPSTGLHSSDIVQLLQVLQSLVEKENTVIVIEHNVDIIRQSDWIIDLGPAGGDAGGTLVATGTPAQVAQNENSKIAPYLQRALA